MNTIKVTVNCHGLIQIINEPSPNLLGLKSNPTLSVEPGITVKRLLYEIGIPGSLDLLIFVDGQPSRFDLILEDGMRIDVFSLAAGG